MAEYANNSGYPMPVNQLPNGAGYVYYGGSSFQVWEDLAFASGSSFSSKLDCGEGMAAIGVHLPLNFTGSTLSLYGSYDIDDMYPISNADGAISIPVVSRSISLPIADLYGWRFLQFKSASNQRETISIKVRLTTF